MCSLCGVGAAFFEMMFMLVTSMLMLFYSLIMALLDWALLKISKK